MSSQPNTLSPGRRVASQAATWPEGRRGRAVPWAGCIPAIGIIVFLFVLAPTSATAADKTTWEKYNNEVPGDTNTTSTNGRIPIGSTAGTGDEKQARQPTVVKIGSVYKMWYCGQDTGSVNRIYYATSTDGLTWKKYDNSIHDPSDTTSTNGRIPLGQTEGDTDHAYHPCVIEDGYTYKMWYTGTAGNNRIYHATLDALPEGLIFIGH